MFYVKKDTMNYKLYSLLLIGIAFQACTSQQINRTLDTVLGQSDLSTSEVASGLKEALEVGTNISTDEASKEDGYYENDKIRIPLPPEIRNVESRLRQIGLGGQVDEFVKTLNRGAETAAREARPIFVEAIRGLSIPDAWGILNGEHDAATSYLRDNTSDKLRELFRPHVTKALEQVDATRYYTELVTNYNRLPGVTRIEADLETYTTDRALDGLFLLVAEEEANIREDPAARTTALLRRVFSQAPQ